MTTSMTRRDFINGALVGCGGALMAGCERATNAAATSLAAPDSSWTGYGGVGDYSHANGNTQAVMEAAHRSPRSSLSRGIRLGGRRACRPRDRRRWILRDDGGL